MGGIFQSNRLSVVSSSSDSGGITGDDDTIAVTNSNVSMMTGWRCLTYEAMSVAHPNPICLLTTLLNCEYEAGESTSAMVDQTMTDRIPRMLIDNISMLST